MVRASLCRPADSYEIGVRRGTEPSSLGVVDRIRVIGREKAPLFFLRSFDDLESWRRYGFMRVYGKSKLANILFTRELARRLEGRGVTANCMHPGFVGTNFARNNGPIASAAMLLLRPFIRSPEKGAETAIHLCASREVAGVSGQYFHDCRALRPRDFAENDEDARSLWEVSECMTGLGFRAGGADPAA